jgi:hypothetical protein
MDFIKAVSIIGRDLEEALALLDQLSAIKSTHNAEIELARSRVRSASELLRLLPGLDRVGPPETAKPPESVKVHESVREPETAKVQEPIRATESARVQEPVRATESARAQEPAKTPVAAPEIEPEAPEEIAAVIMAYQEPQMVHEPLKAPETQRSILADRFASTGTFGEKMQSAKQDEVNSSVMHGKHIADIATAIGMNDKFYFIRELFSGDTIAYQDTIKRLNAASSLGEAMRILDESTVMGSDPAAQSSFVDVVRRKFSLNV